MGYQLRTRWLEGNWTVAETEALKEQIALLERYITAMRADLERRPKVAKLGDPEARAQAEYEIATMTGILETLKRLLPPF
jgi:hypothetical protein